MDMKQIFVSSTLLWNAGLEEMFQRVYDNGFDGIELWAQHFFAKGYDTQILEFIDMEHTPKNLLIRAVYTGKDSENAAEALKNMEEALHLNLTLNKLLGE